MQCGAVGAYTADYPGSAARRGAGALHADASLLWRAEGYRLQLLITYKHDLERLLFWYLRLQF